MSLFKRGDTYWCRFTAPNGERIRRSTKATNKKKAQEFEDRLKAELWRVIQLGEKPKMSWKSAVVKYLTECGNKSIKDDISLFRILDKYLNGLELHQIDAATIQRIIEGRKKDGVCNKTINNALKKVQAVLKRADEDWKVLCDPPKIRLLPTKNIRIRWITQTEAARLLKELPPHLRAMAAFSLETGLRKTNVTHLKWSQINLQNRTATFEADDILKSNKAFSIPLSDGAIDIIRQQMGNHHEYIFTFRGKPVTEVNTKSWRAALKRAGIKDFRWHDLRHTWATWHVQNGTPLHILQELGNWSSYEMVKRYAHFTVDHLAQYVTGTKLTQCQFIDEKKPVTNIR